MFAVFTQTACQRLPFPHRAERILLVLDVALGLGFVQRSRTNAMGWTSSLSGINCLEFPNSSIPAQLPFTSSAKLSVKGSFLVIGNSDQPC